MTDVVYAPSGGLAPPELGAYSADVVTRLRALTGRLPDALREPVHALTANPGKRLRSTLLGACAHLAGHDRTRVVRLGAVVELLHLASLVHDDVIDRADVRRDMPAAHVVAGNEVAVLAGLACFALAGMEAADLGAGVDRMVSRTVAELAYGEMLDVERAFDTSLTLVEYLELAERKTGQLFRLCCLLGAREAGLGAAETAALTGFGTDLGVAFQIVDDCLDLAAEHLDKPTGTDQFLGLFGAPILCALRSDGSGELAALLLAPSPQPGDLAAARSLVIARGGLDSALALAHDRRERALAALAALPAGDARDVLAQVAAAAWREP